MNKTSLRQSLVWRLALALLGILVILGLSYILITAYSAKRYYQETTQKLNAHVAEHMLLEVNPFVDGAVNEEALGKIMHSMMAVNPTLEVYLLDESGAILSYVVLDKKVRLKSVDISPVKEFISSGGKGFVLGDDPRKPGEQTVFSATSIEENGELQGYVYMVLASESYENVSQALLGSYFIRVGTSTFIITLIFSLGLGVVLIFFLTKNVRNVAETMRAFADGDYQKRVEISRKDELATIGETFNSMADTIVKNIDELKEVDTLRRELIANVSHDLRSPLAVINGYIETLVIKDAELNQEQRKKYLDIIFRSGQKLNRLVTDLFELSKLESGQVKLEQEKIAISEEVERITEEYRLIAKKKGIEIKTEIDSGANTNVLADVKLINRVFQNLLDNAVKYAPENGNIDVKLELEQGAVKTTVSNSVNSINPKELEHLFDRNYRAGNSQKDSGAGGMGLGLAIVKKILEVHDSIIKVSTFKDQRISFTFQLPIAP